MACLKVVALLSMVLCVCESYKILAVFPMPAHSHYTISFKIIKELAKKEHQITLVTPYIQKIPVENVKEISVEPLISIINERKKHLYALDQQTVFESVRFMTNLGYILTEETLKNENVQKLLQSKENYDLVIIPQFLNEALLGIGHHFKAPVVLLSSMPLFSWGSYALAHPSPSSYVPNVLTHYTGRMDFGQRLCNSVYDAYTILYHQWMILPKHRQLVKEYIPGEPDLYTLINNVSLLLINTHVSSYDAMPQVPNAIEIGGIHLEEPKQLSEDLQKFLDDSVNGVVVFSMGSNLKSSALPTFKRDAILKSFSKLKQNVLWKWETDELPGQSKNVKLMEWLPQSDVLAHPNVRVFITHGGMLSTMESIYHGVPAIGIPIFADQKMNMATAVAYGYAEVVPFQELTEEKLSFALEQVLNDPKYKRNAIQRSKIMRDRPIKPTDAAIYWIEYVIRHQGAPHLRYPGMDLTWFQRNLLDVAAFVVIVGVTILTLIFFILNTIWKKVCNVQDNLKKTN